MSVEGLEKTLRSLESVGKLVKDRGYRQVWRFVHEGRAYYLKFYPKQGARDRIRRIFRGSPALAEFTKLQRLQSAGVPAPHPVAVLMGFTISGRIGDAVIIEAIEPGVALDQYLNEFEIRGESAPNHIELARQVREIVLQLEKARLGHEDLHLGNFLLHDGKLFLLDAYAVRIGGMTIPHLMHLGHSVSRFATRTDLIRGWRELGPNRAMPRQNSAAEKEWANFIRRRVKGENAYFGRISFGAWSGSFFKVDKHPRRWSSVSRLQISREDWDRELPALLEKIEHGELKFIKRGNSGDVLAGEITVGGQRVGIIVKRPRHRYWYRYVNGAFRGTRARREWFKAWKMIVRNLPTAWPLLYVEKRQFGYVTDGVIIFERIPGEMLAKAKLDEMPAKQRDILLRRAGRMLRRIDRLGFAHFDAKSANWIIRADEKLGPTPIMIDIDGIRHRRWTALGIDRLLRSMREHKQYSVADSFALCQGYAPGAALAREETTGELTDDLIDAAKDQPDQHGEDSA